MWQLLREYTAYSVGRQFRSRALAPYGRRVLAEQCLLVLQPGAIGGGCACVDEAGICSYNPTILGAVQEGVYRRLWKSIARRMRAGFYVVQRHIVDNCHLTEDFRSLPRRFLRDPPARR